MLNITYAIFIGRFEETKLHPSMHVENERERDRKVITTSKNAKWRRNLVCKLGLERTEIDANIEMSA